MLALIELLGLIGYRFVADFIRKDDSGHSQSVDWNAPGQLLDRLELVENFSDCYQLYRLMP